MCDTAYGPVHAQRIARHSPELALRNADNYVCYIAEVYLGLRFGFSATAKQELLDKDLPGALHSWLRTLDVDNYALLSQHHYGKPLDGIHLLSRGMYGKGLMPHCSAAVGEKDEL